MFKLIDRQSPELPTLKRRRLADPDVLLEIAQRLSNQAGTKNGDLQQLFSYVLHDVRMNGVWKRTNAGRLRHTEEMLCKYTAPCYRHSAQILDLGASDGITTVELLRALRHAWGGAVTVYLADLNLWLHRYRIGCLVEYRSADGEPIMARVGRIGLRLARGNEREAELNALSRWYLRLASPLRRSMRPDVRISLVNPAAAHDPGISIKELNCLKRCEELVGKFAAVRASNILNLSYFSSATISEIVGHVHSYLRDDGCLVVSRNVGDPETEVENGSIWIKHSDRMQWMEDFGSGSDVKAIVDTWRYRKL